MYYMNFHSYIRDQRKQRGLTQIELANLSQVGIATIQNIEAGKANPEIKTLEKILSAMGLELVSQKKPINWDLLTSLGIPLLRSSGAEMVRPDKALLLSTLPDLIAVLANLDKHNRESSAIISFLWALQDHYPTTYSRIAKVQRSQIEKQFMYGTPKLRRLSIAKLQEYL